MQGFEHARKQILLGLLKDPDADWPAHPKNHFHGSAILRVGEILGLKPQFNWDSRFYRILKRFQLLCKRLRRNRSVYFCSWVPISDNPWLVHACPLNAEQNKAGYPKHKKNHCLLLATVVIFELMVSHQCHIHKAEVTWNLIVHDSRIATTQNVVVEMLPTCLLAILCFPLGRNHAVRIFERMHKTTVSFKAAALSASGFVVTMMSTACLFLCGYLLAHTARQFNIKDSK